MSVVAIPADGIVPIACVSVNRAAALLGVCRELVIEWINDGKLDAFKQPLLRSPVTGRRRPRPGSGRRHAFTLWIRIEDVTELAERRRPK